MRKLIVVLMAVLMLVSFTSCNQDKIDELEKKVKEQEAEIAKKNAEDETYYKFAKDLYSVTVVKEAYKDLLSKGWTAKENPITLNCESDSDKKRTPNFEGEDIRRVWFQKTLSLTENAGSCCSLTDAAGTVTLAEDYTSSNINCNFVNNKVTYEIEDTKGSEDKRKYELAIDGSLIYKSVDNSAVTSETITVSFKGTIDGEKIDLSCTLTQDDVSGLKFTSAESNGNKISTDRLNALENGMGGLSILFGAS